MGTFSVLSAHEVGVLNRGQIYAPLERARSRRSTTSAPLSLPLSLFSSNRSLALHQRLPLQNWHDSRGSAQGLNSRKGGKRSHRSLVAASLYGEEAIGAEHGEGFATFRPGGALQVDVDYLNDRMQEKGLQRIRFAMRPDEAFGLIYSWDNVIADTRAVRLQSWKSLAGEAGKALPSSLDTLRMLTATSPERAVREVLRWAEDENEVAQLAERAAELYCHHLSQVRAPMGGVREWLGALAKAGVPCAVSSSIDRLTLLAALDRMKLFHFFRAFVSSEDGMESIAHRFLSAAVKLDRPPSKCVVFEDDPRGITAAHNCSMKAVALIGQHTAYELQQADLAVSSFGDLSVINLRRLFANRGLGLEFMEVQQQREGKRKPKRRITLDTMF